MSTWLSFFINLHHYTGITFLCSAFNLFQEENVTFFSPLSVDSIGKKFQNLIFRQIVFFFAAFIKHDLAVV